MKYIFWLLLLINLGLLAYFSVENMQPPLNLKQNPPIHPEKITLLSAQALAEMPKLTTAPASEAAKAEPSKTTCAEWGVFSSTNLADAQKALEKLTLQAKVKTQGSTQPKRFWIYIPPLASTEAAQQRAAELKSQGIEDLFVVQEAQWKNAISFGIFEDEQLASKLLLDLQAKDIKNVAKTLRATGTDHASLLLQHITPANIANIKKLKPDFPEAELKEVGCGV